MKKILIIRFSSIGDVIQCMSVTAGLKKAYPDAQIHWITRKDMSGMLHTDPQITRIWEFDRNAGLKGLIEIAQLLKDEKFDLIYDAHCNLRSKIVKFIVSPFYRRWFKHTPKVVTRRKNRLTRLLFFTFRQEVLIKLPFRSMVSFQKPLTKALGISFENLPPKLWIFDESDKGEGWKKELCDFIGTNSKVVTLIPSAAWELKRWPVDYWKQLIAALPGYKFILIGGPKDIFCEEIKNTDASRCLNLAGKTSLLGSFYVVNHSNYVVSGDTGFLHAADLFGTHGVALMGPTAFGHPTGKTIDVLEIFIPCKPCTKAGDRRCTNDIYKFCMVSLTPAMVKEKINNYFKMV